MKVLLFALLSSLGSYQVLGANFQTVTLWADEWCPYNCAPNSQQEGYVVEIAKKSFDIANSKDKSAKYLVVYKTKNWQRSIKNTRAGKKNYDGIIGAFVDDAPDFIFPKEELGIASNHFFVPVESKWKFEGFEKVLPQQKIGI